MTPAWQAGVRFRQRGSVAFLVKGGDAYQVNAVGARIWSLCDGEHTMDDVSSAVAASFGVSLEQARTDVTEYVEELIRMQLLVAE